MELNNIKSSNLNWGDAANDLNQNFGKINNAIEQVKNVTTRNKGYFSSSDKLLEAYPSAHEGDIAYVKRSGYTPFERWRWNGAAWKGTGESGGNDNVSLGDYYTQEEIDGKFTNQDEKLSELGSEVNENKELKTDMKVGANFVRYKFLKGSAYKITNTSTKPAEFYLCTEESTDASVRVQTIGAIGVSKAIESDVDVNFLYGYYQEEGSCIISPLLASDYRNFSSRCNISIVGDTVSIGEGFIYLTKNNNEGFSQYIAEAVSYSITGNDNLVFDLIENKVKVVSNDIIRNYMVVLIDRDAVTGFCGGLLYEYERLKRISDVDKIIEKKQDYSGVQAITRSSLSVNGSKITMGSGFTYIYINGIEKVFRLSEPVEYDLYSNKSLVFNETINKLEVVERASINSKTMFPLLVHDGVKGICSGLLYDFITVKRLEDLNSIISKNKEEVSSLGRVIGVNSWGTKVVDNVLFTSAEIKPEETIRYKFALRGAAGAIGFFNENDERLSFVGISGVTAGYVMEGEVKLPKLYSYAKVIWSSLDIEYIINSNSPLNQSSNINTVSVRGFFKDELAATINEINLCTEKECLVLNLLTDNHLADNDLSRMRTKDTMLNLAWLNKSTRINGIVHLGDYVTNGYDESTAMTDIQKYAMDLRSINSNLFAVNGNHDSKNANNFYEDEWYAYVGRINVDYVKRGYGNPYYYKDFDWVKTRCIFLAIPDSVDNEYMQYAYTDRCLDWLKNEALNLKDKEDYNVIFFAHVSPLGVWYKAGDNVINRGEFNDLTKSFNNHTGVYSAYSGKIVAYFCGHQHFDLVVNSGERMQGTDADGVSFTDVNDFDFPIIYTDANAHAVPSQTVEGSIHHERVDGTVTQDLWDTIIYTPKLNLIKLIRFGAGSNREVVV